MELSMMTDGSNDSDALNKNAAAGRWTTEEHALFILGLQIHNKQWKNIADMVKTRTVVQIRTHAQKYFQKLEKTNPNGSAFPPKSMSESNLFVETNALDSEDVRLTHYRAHSIGSTDSADSSKYARSVSLGSDGGNDSDSNSGLLPPAGGGVPHCTSFPSDMLIHSYLGGVDLKPRSATMTDMKTNTAPKKRSRDSVIKTAATANPPKSPKRSSHKQLSNSNSHLNMATMGMPPMSNMSYGASHLHHSASECDELDMISLLEKIDWNAIPSPHRSPASSPFTDSAASLSSSSGHICYKSVLNKCNNASSPLQFSHIDQVNVNEELTDNDVFDVFDEYYRNLDMTTVPPTSSTSDAKPIQNTIVPMISVPEAKIQPRVWFSSSVICELKTKVQPGFSIGHGILKPWRDRKPVSRLPPLHSLTSNSPPVVIDTQSLTLLDSTFCNFPPPLYQDGMELGGANGYSSDGVTTVGSNNHSSSTGAYCIGTSALNSPSGEDIMGSPKAFASFADFNVNLPPQSPATKKRGRPRKSSVSSASGTSNGLKSRSCSNLSASNVPQPFVTLPSYPSFPNIGTTSVFFPPDMKESRSRKNSASTGNLPAHFDDFMMSCCDVDVPNSFAHQLSHEHDPNYVPPVMSHNDGMYENSFHAEAQNDMDISMSFGFDEHELQADAAAGAVNVGGSAVASTTVKQEESEDLYDMLSVVFD